jgi:hypothetical protein
LIEHGFATRDDLEAALVYLHDGSPKPSRDAVRVVGDYRELEDA